MLEGYLNYKLPSLQIAGSDHKIELCKGLKDNKEIIPQKEPNGQCVKTTHLKS